MRYKEGKEKNQQTLLPASLEDYVPENHICRVISAFTAQLDIALLGYKYAQSKETGCLPFDPRMMLNLYIYGYLHRVRSSRRLEAETQRNVEVMWLMDGLCPDDKTISNFAKIMRMHCEKPLAYLSGCSESWAFTAAKFRRPTVQNFAPTILGRTIITR